MGIDLWHCYDRQRMAAIQYKIFGRAPIQNLIWQRSLGKRKAEKFKQAKTIDKSKIKIAFPSRSALLKLFGRRVL